MASGHSAKRVKDMHKMLLAERNITIVQKPYLDGKRIVCRVRAENGTEANFEWSDQAGDIRGDLNERGRVRRWARAHGTLPLPGIEEIEVLDLSPKDPSDMEVAVLATVFENTPATKEFAERVYRKQPLVNPVRKLIAGANMSRVQEEQFEESIEVIDQMLAEPPPTKAPMPRKLTLAKPVMTPTDAPEPKPKRKQIMRIGQVEFFKLCTVLNALDMIGISTFSKLAERLTVAYGSPVAESTAKDALEATGRKLDKVQIEATDAQVIIAKTLTALLIKLSEPVPDELRKLCGEIE